MQVECDTSLESFQGELQVYYRPHPNRRSEQRIMTLQNPRNPSRDNFGTPPWESLDKKPFGCRCCRKMQGNMGEGGGFPPVQAMMNHVSPELPVACPSTKGALESELTNLLVGLLQVRVSN